MSIRRPTDNFELIAANLTSFYSTLVRSYKDLFVDDAAILITAGIIDVVKYIDEGSITVEDIIEPLRYVVKRENALLEIICRVERIIFPIDTPEIERELIYDAIDSQRNRIKEMMNMVLQFHKDASIDEPIVIQAMQDAGFQKC